MQNSLALEEKSDVEGKKGRR